MLAEKLNMTPDNAERWIVNLIRNARLDAKIDSKLGHVVMGTQAVSPYQQVIEKTKNLAFRSQVLALTIEKKTGGHNKQDVREFFFFVSFLINMSPTLKTGDKVHGCKGVLFLSLFLINV